VAGTQAIASPEVEYFDDAVAVHNVLSAIEESAGTGKRVRII
jgi:hypothetical protein